MDTEGWVKIMMALVGGITGKTAWDFFNSRMVARDKKLESQKQDQFLYRDDLRTEVDRLRDDLHQIQAKRDEQFSLLQEKREAELETFRSEISELKAENASLRTQVSFLKSRISELTS